MFEILIEIIAKQIYKTSKTYKTKVILLHNRDIYDSLNNVRGTFSLFLLFFQTLSCSCKWHQFLEISKLLFTERALLQLEQTDSFDSLTAATDQEILASPFSSLFLVPPNIVLSDCSARKIQPKARLTKKQSIITSLVW